MSRTVIFLAVVLLLGCASPPKTETPLLDPVASLNRQIEDFNASRFIPDPNRGIDPIDKRVARLEYDRTRDQATAYDQGGVPFLVLSREPDGRLKGVLEQPYHQLAFSGPGGGHSWGYIHAEFYLPKGTF